MIDPANGDPERMIREALLVYHYGQRRVDFGRIIAVSLIAEDMLEVRLEVYPYQHAPGTEVRQFTHRLPRQRLRELDEEGLVEEVVAYFDQWLLDQGFAAPT